MGHNEFIEALCHLPPAPSLMATVFASTISQTSNPSVTRTFVRAKKLVKRSSSNSLSSQSPSDPMRSPDSLHSQATPRPPKPPSSNKVMRTKTSSSASMSYNSSPSFHQSINQSINQSSNHSTKDPSFNSSPDFSTIQLHTPPLMVQAVNTSRCVQTPETDKIYMNQSNNQSNDQTFRRTCKRTFSVAESIAQINPPMQIKMKCEFTVCESEPCRTQPDQLILEQQLNHWKSSKMRK